MLRQVLGIARLFQLKKVETRTRLKTKFYTMIRKVYRTEYSAGRYDHRYKALPQPGHRLQFLEVQLELLDEYRVRCVQVARELQAEPVTSHYPSILSTLHTLISTLEEWGDMPVRILPC
jgi:hypothetical protein